MIDYNTIFNVASANDIITDTQQEAEPVKLWDEFWYEHEVCCLFADANAGKSLLAVQIARDIAHKMPTTDTVLYYDFELSKRQFSARYTYNGQPYHFPSNFLRIDINIKQIDEICEQSRSSFEDIIIHGIESNIQKYNGKIVIIDNISWLSNMKESATMAGRLMKQLCALKQNYDLSILVLAHTPKRNLKTPLTQNSLSGSKKYTNFFDAMFAIGVSTTDEDIRYLKQIKVRTGAFKYNASNVKLYTIGVRNNFLGFIYKGLSSEEKQLQDNQSSKNMRQDYRAKRKSLMGVTTQFIESLAKQQVKKMSQ